MNKKTSIIIGVAVALLSAIAVLVLFASCFSTDAGFGEEFGTAFTVMFGSTSRGYGAVSMLIVAFSLECLGFVLAIAAPITTGKVRLSLFALTAISLVAAGVIFLFSSQLFRAVNSTHSLEALNLGAAPITSAVFAFLGGALSCYGAYISLKD